MSKQEMTTIQEIEKLKNKLMDEIRDGISRHGFNNIVRAGVNHETLARIQRGDDVKTNTLVNTKKIIDSLNK